MPNYPEVIFDLRHRSLEVRLRDAPVAGTLELDDAHLVDVDAEDRPVAIEILTLDNLRLEEMADRFGFSDHVPAIRAEIEKVATPTGTAASYGAPVVIPGNVLIDADVEPTETEPDRPTWVIN